MIKNGKFLLALGIVLVVASTVLFWRLGSAPLTNWDEGAYAEVARTMHAGGSWWLPNYHGQLFLEKPPLAFWLMDIAFKVFGVHEFAARFWSALAGVATAGLLTIWTWQLKKKWWLALLAGLIFVSGRFMFFHAFRTGDTDALLVFFSTLTLYSYWRTSHDQRWWWGVGIATGMAIMTKSFVGLLPQVVIDLDLVLSRGYRTISWRRAMQGLGLLLLVILPWHIAVAIHHGSELWHQVVGFTLLEHSSSAIGSSSAPWYWYGPTIYNFFFPISAFLPLALAAAAWRWLRGEAISRTMLLWVIIIFVVFAASATKFDHYIQPLYPVLALLVVLLMDELWARKNFWMSLGWWLSIIVLFFSFPPRLAHEGFLWRMTPYAWLPASWANGMGGRILVAKGVTIALFGLLWLISRWTKKSLMSVTAALTAAYLIVLSLGWQYSYIKHLPVTSNAKQIAAKLSPNISGRVEVYGISHLTEPALYFYLGRLAPVGEVQSDETPTAQTVISTKKAGIALRRFGYFPSFVQGQFIAWRNRSE